MHCLCLCSVPCAPPYPAGAIAIVKLFLVCRLCQASSALAIDARLILSQCLYLLCTGTDFKVATSCTAARPWILSVNSDVPYTFVTCRLHLGTGVYAAMVMTLFLVCHGPANLPCRPGSSAVAEVCKLCRFPSTDDGLHC